jgi:signal transduction histidine kinase/FixJ family two-component response regulator
LYGCCLHFSGVASIRDPLGIIELLDRLADRAQRAEIAAELARRWSADALFMLVRDHELGVLRPAAGFQQTLPGGALWRRFLAQCARPGEHQGEVSFPDRKTIASALAYATAEGFVLVLVGGVPNLSYTEFKKLPFALISALLRTEATEQAASGAVAAAREVTQRTAALASALDRARGETQAKAAELQRALAEAAHLNEQLRQLNNTLEHRVSERTRELETQTEERLKAEAALLQSQKMEAVGQLTGGVAHDFNNLLSIIIGSLDLMEPMAADNPRLQRAVNMAQRAADRGARLTEQLLAFARRQVLRPQIIELNEIIGEYQGLLRRAVGEAVELRTELSRELCYCHIDPVHLETAILNLAINARDAMPAGGILVIELNRCVDREPIPDLGPSMQVRITVRDSGSGMSPDVVDRVFEPFFTTKPEGKGTGLGLSQVYGFVQQSGGRIAIETELGKGTAIHIYLPLVEGKKDSVEHCQTKQSTRTAGSETILVVDDDADVREIIVSMLEHAGYKIKIASNGVEALSVLKTDQVVDLLFTDLVMPGGITGVQLAHAAQELRPGINILLTSGYTAAAGITDDAMRDGFPLVLKPYRQHELITSIRSVLDQSSTRLAIDERSSVSRVTLTGQS